MFTNAGSQVHVPPRTFLATVAWGVSVAVLAVILGGTGVILYGMSIADRRSDDLIGLITAGVRNLPELRNILPPALAEAFNDERRPEYRDRIEVTGRIAAAGGHCDGGLRPVIEVRNRGGEVVSLLSLHVVVLEGNDPVAERNEWAATPFAADRDWRGPLMPGAKVTILGRPLPPGRTPAKDALRVEANVTDIRVWHPAPTEPASRPTSAATDKS